MKALGADEVSLRDVEEKLGEPTRTGYSIAQLAKIAGSYGFHTMGVQTNADSLQLRSPPFACISLIRGSHFVNFSEIQSGEVVVIDPPRDYVLPLATVGSIWEGHALLISREPLEAEETLGRTSKIAWRAATVLGAVIGAGGCVWLWRKRR